MKAMEQNAVKRIPYGVSDFVNVIERNQYYVDKTMYIPMLEDQADNLFCISPRRFGKSVFLGMLQLFQLDKLDGDRKGVIKTIAEKGEIIGNIEESFPASALTNPNIFISLLFYYGMLTIKGTLGDQLILGIPNNNVRKQYYNYLLEQYQEEKCLNINNLRTMFTYMAYEGKWRECLEFMAKAYADEIATICTTEKPQVAR